MASENNNLVFMFFGYFVCFFQLNLSNNFTDHKPISLISKLQNTSAVNNTNNENELVLIESLKHLRALFKSN